MKQIELNIYISFVIECSGSNCADALGPHCNCLYIRAALFLQARKMGRFNKYKSKRIVWMV